MEQDQEYLDLLDALTASDQAMPQMQVANEFSVGNEVRKPLIPKSSYDAAAEFPAKGPGAAAYMREQPAGFDWRRAIVAAGKGDVGAYDRNRALRDPLSLESQQRDALLEEQAAKRQQAALARARLDPNSEASKAARSEYAQLLASYAALPDLPAGLKAELAAAQERATRMSGAQIDKALPQVMNLMKFAQSSQHNRAQESIAAGTLGVRRSDVQADNTRQTDALEETKRHNRVMEANADPANKPVKVKLPGETTLKQYRERSLARKQIARLRELFPKVRYTGAGADSLNAMLSKAPGELDVRNPEEREFASIIKRLRAPERKNIFGAALSKFDIADSEGFMAGIGNNKEQLLTNLQTLDDALAFENEQLAEQYPTISGDQLPGATPAAAAEHKKAPAGAKPGQRFPNKIDGKVYVVQPDGTMLPE